jgi:hypothetical protein
MNETKYIASDIGNGDFVPVFLKCGTEIRMTFLGLIPMPCFRPHSYSNQVAERPPVDFFNFTDDYHTANQQTSYPVRHGFHHWTFIDENQLRPTGYKVGFDCYIVSTTSKDYADDLSFMRKCFSGKSEGFCQLFKSN